MFRLPRTSSLLGLIAGAGLVACFPRQVAVDPADAGGHSSPQPLSLASTGEADTWEITETGVGPLAIGRSLPVAWVPGRLEPHYVTTFYADAQPLEGFTFDEPNLFAVVSGGPFEAFGRSTLDPTPPPEIVAEATRRARRGELTVKMLVITHPGLETAAGVGVGTRYDRLMAQYPEATTLDFPGLWEEPSCIVRPSQTSNLWFFFGDCGSTSDGSIDGRASIIRVVVREG